MRHFYLLLLMVTCTVTTLLSQATIRGVVYDQESGEAVMFANVYTSGNTTGTTTNIDGFYSLRVEPGTYTLICKYIGYDSTAVTVTVEDGQILNQPLYLTENAVNLGVVDVTGKREKKQRDVGISAVTLTPKDIKIIPSTGGEADLAQYLQVLPGVIFTGDQGGQLYIRGGSPVQNKVLLDGMTIYNPFHSIGFFSVFETETIKNVEVLTGGFNAEYGGRVSAVMDITTRDGNKKRYGGLVGVNPFQAKLLLEGPIQKLKENGSSSSFIVTGKHSYINETSKEIYSYIDTAGLPYSFTDLYAKASFNTGGGSKFNVFGFNFTDNVNFSGVTELGWDTYGGGIDFTLIPATTRMIIGGRFSFSDYNISLTEADEAPRTSLINGFTAGLDFTYYGKDDEIKYGFVVNGNQTAFSFTNLFGNEINHEENTTELAAFAKYKRIFGRLVVEPSVRMQYYAALDETTFEPRLGVKLNVTDNLRFKFAGGVYTQDLISAVNERDIVNLFVGFISSPSDVAQPNSAEEAESRLQRSIHGIAGVEIDVNDNIEINIEPYIKDFPQLISLNRNKETIDEPNFITEEGQAYGIDFLLKYQTQDLFLWWAYSLGYVNRNDGEQEYPTNFDRRHNTNIVLAYKFGAEDNWEISARWNLGTGFPFTLTQGFYNQYNFENGINSDYISGNGDLGIIYDENRNAGRLPTYHRMDMSLKYKKELSKNSLLEVTGSITNVYDRSNIFFFDRVRYERVDQLPIIPSLGMTLSF